MPTVLIEEGFRFFFFYSNEGFPREPVHLYVEKSGLEAKFWLRPEVTVAYNDGYDARTLRRMVAMTQTHRARIERARNEYFG